MCRKGCRLQMSEADLWPEEVEAEAEEVRLVLELGNSDTH